MASSAVLAIWVDIDPADDEAFNHWHSREHVQERVGCPGWLRGSRFKGIDRPGRYLLFYDAETTAAFESDAYYARLRHPSALSRAIFPKFNDAWRTVCSVERRQGGGIGAAVLTVRGDVSAFDALAALKPARLDLLKGEATIGQAHTTEKDLRPAPDRQIDQALLAFFRSVADAKTARDRHAPSGEIFALQHTVSKGDLYLSSRASARDLPVP
ncbi:MAG: hypothetical protein J0J01_30375 [Reyranella sp.]|uniref:DUF4286 family protein n=1 Tax=Reyranella sp. TaxID=1929291 RepID=UPI001ACDE016|nr:DUF4286 family protein [Reyranella sp.]MBN9091246.1 hypothetical protein [Reyranella sp.]